MEPNLKITITIINEVPGEEVFLSIKAEGSKNIEKEEIIHYLREAIYTLEYNPPTKLIRVK